MVLTITGTYGVAAVVPDDFGEANINQHCVRMSINDKVQPEYLAAFLNSQLCKSQMDRAVTGSSRLALDYTSIRKLTILVPSDPKEQEHIVQTVREQLRKARDFRESAALEESDMSLVVETFEST